MQTFKLKDVIEFKIAVCANFLFFLLNLVLKILRVENICCDSIQHTLISLSVA